MITNHFNHPVEKVLRDGYAYLALLDDDTYSQPISVLSGSTIGQHTRHWLEFFKCFLNQYATESTICYDLRKREKSLETSLSAAQTLMEDIRLQLPQIDRQRSITLEAQIGNQCWKMPSSVERELWYLVEHAIHHLAIIKIGLQSVQPTAKLPEDFGLAYSTAQHQQRASVSAS